MRAILYQLTHSLNGLRLLVGLVTVGIAAMLLYLTWSLVNENHLSEAQVEGRLHQTMLHAKAVVLEGILRRHEDTVEKLASESLAVDQVQFADSKEQEDWALESRRFLTDSLGLALISADGSIGGDPARLRMGPQCMHDLERALSGEALPHPLVHRDIKGLEHIDVISPIQATEGGTPAGPVIGYLFASFHLSVLKDWLDALTDPGYRLSVTTDGDELVCQSDRLLADIASDQTETLSESIPGTQLSLNLTRPVAATSDFFGHLTVLLLWGLLALVVLPIAASFWFWKLVKGDFCTLHHQLTDIGRGIAEPERSDRPTLIDMQPIADEMYALVTRIGMQQSNLSHQSMHDHLTELPNRRYIEEELRRVCAQVQRGICHSVMLVDLDHFKPVNDTLGHDAGDEILSGFSRCLHSKLRAADFAGRWGGDEFVLISRQSLSEAEHADGDVDHVVERLRDCFGEAQQSILIGTDLAVTLSIGRVTLAVGSEPQPDEVMQQADAALYQAKEKGRNTLVSHRYKS